MNTNTAVDYRNPGLVRRMGIEALAKELGPIGMVYFIQQFDRGEGNYTIERESLLSNLTMEDALCELEKFRE
jgi:hypothetical protein